jgi:hypothetical protein
MALQPGCRKSAIKDKCKHRAFAVAFDPIQTRRLDPG